MPQDKEVWCVSADMEALTNIKDPAPVGNRTPVNKPYVINTI
jgi:hypothetical protein